MKTLTQLCVEATIRIIENAKFNHKVIKYYLSVIPEQLRGPIFNILIDKGILTDVTLLLFLIPGRTTLTLSASANIRNSTLKQIAYNCPNMMLLNLSDCVQVSNSVIRIILQGCPKLSNLILDRCHRVTDAAFDVLQSPFLPLLGCSSLEAISLQGCPQITGDIVTTLNKLCHKLKYLNLSQCKQIASSIIKHVFEHSQLLTLNLAFADSVSDEAFLSLPLLSSVEKSPNFSPLRKLHLGKSVITDLSIFRMAYLGELVEIRLQWCHGITDQGVEALTRNCPRLKVIDLQSCLITDKAIFSIAKRSKEIKVLDLSWCTQITDKAFSNSKISQYCLNSLEHLLLAWCSKISDVGLISLLGLSNLKTIEIAGCSDISKACVDKITNHGIVVVS